VARPPPVPTGTSATSTSGCACPHAPPDSTAAATPTVPAACSASSGSASSPCPTGRRVSRGLQWHWGGGDTRDRHPTQPQPWEPGDATPNATPNTMPNAIPKLRHQPPMVQSQWVLGAPTPIAPSSSVPSLGMGAGGPRSPNPAFRPARSPVPAGRGLRRGWLLRASARRVGLPTAAGAGAELPRPPRGSRLQHQPGLPLPGWAGLPAPHAWARVSMGLPGDPEVGGQRGTLGDSRGHWGPTPAWGMREWDRGPTDVPVPSPQEGVGAPAGEERVAVSAALSRHRGISPP